MDDMSEVDTTIIIEYNSCNNNSCGYNCCTYNK